MRSPALCPGTGRREFLRAALAGVGAVLAGPRPAWGFLAGTPVLRLVLATGPAGEQAPGARGAVLGAEEAARAGALVGRALELTLTSDPGAAAGLRAAGAAALLGGGSVEECRALAAAAEAAGGLFLNIACGADELRAGCGGRMLHVAASDAMQADALRLARAADPTIPAEARAVLWHPSLERFGAGQLNDRFRARFGAPMDGAAWAGWMGVKVLWEASLRAGRVEPEALLTYLRRPDARFDGHKGWPLSFRAASAQLRQPLYVITEAGVVAEMPGRSDAGARDALDVLGPAETGRCAEAAG